MFWSGAVADGPVDCVQRLVLHLGHGVAVQHPHGDVHVVTVRVQPAHVDCLRGHGDEDRDGPVLGLEEKIINTAGLSGATCPAAQINVLVINNWREGVKPGEMTGKDRADLPVV